MRGFGKLTRETWKFYLAALILTGLLMLCDSVYIISEHNSAYNGKVFEYHMEQDSKEKFLEKNGGYMERGKDYCGIVEDKVYFFEPFGMIAVLLLIALILLGKQTVFMDRRTVEFQFTLPVKQRTLIIHDYLAGLVLLLVAVFGQGVILLCDQTHYNRNILDMGKQFQIADINEGIVSWANERFMTSMTFYFLFLVIFYTWIYLGITVAKNPVIGAVTAIPIWYVIYDLVSTCAWLRLESHGWPGFGEIWQEGERLRYDRMVDSISWLESMMSPYEFVWKDELIAVEGHSLLLTAGIMGDFALLLFLALLFLGNKRELSRGKLFYFPILDYPFSLLTGLAVVVFLEASDLFYALFSSYDGAECLTWIAVSVGICLLIHPFSGRKQEKWEVR